MTTADILPPPPQKGVFSNIYSLKPYSMFPPLPRASPFLSLLTTIVADSVPALTFQLVLILLRLRSYL
jgi:hypothetical protein